MDVKKKHRFACVAFCGIVLLVTVAAFFFSKKTDYKFFKNNYQLFDFFTDEGGFVCPLVPQEFNVDTMKKVYGMGYDEYYAIFQTMDIERLMDITFTLNGAVSVAGPKFDADGKCCGITFIMRRDWSDWSEETFQEYYEEIVEILDHYCASKTGSVWKYDGFKALFAFDSDELRLCIEET